MKITTLKSGLVALALTASITSCSKKAEGYTINGKIDGIKDGLVYLETFGDSTKVVDSAKVIDGKFTFTGSVTEPLLHTIKLKGVEYGRSFLLDNESIGFKALKDSIYKGKIEGAKQDSIYQSFYQNEFAKIQKIAFPLYQLSDSLYKVDAQNKAIPKGKLSEEHRVFMDKKWADLQVIADKETADYIEKNKSNIGAVLVLDDRLIKYPNPKLAKQMYEILSPEVKQSFYGKKVKASVDLFEKTAVGAAAPAFSQTDVNGKIVKLSDYKGKYVLIDFWASWCGPCRKENPNVVEAYKTYHDKGFEVLGISLDDKKEPWLKAIEKDGLTWTHVSDLKGWKNEAAKIYGVSVVPTNYLIGPDGKIVASNLREEALQTKLKEIFSKS